MVQPEEVEPVEDAFESAFCAMAPAWEEIVERFGPVFQFLHLPLHHLPEPAPVHVDMVFEIHRFACQRIPLCAVGPDLMATVFPD